MAAVGDFLFGSSDPGGYQGQVPTVTKDQSKLLKELIGMVRGNVGQGVDPYPGTTTPQASDLQTRAFETLSGILGGPQLDTVNKSVEQLMAGPTNYSGKFSPPAVREYWEDTFATPARRSWEQDILPGIREKYIANDALDSGAARRAVVSSAGDLETGLNAQLASLLFGEKSQADQMTFNAEDNYLDRLLNVPGMQTSNLLAPVTQALGAGGIQRGIEGEGLQEEFNKWLMSQSYNNPWLTQFAPMVLGTKATEPVVTGPSQQSGLFQDIVTPLLGGYLSTETGAAAAPQIFNPANWFGG